MLTPGAAGAVFAKGRSSSKAAAAPGEAGGAEGPEGLEGGGPTVAAPRPNNEAAAAAMGKHGREDLWVDLVEFSESPEVLVLILYASGKCGLL